jgi:lipopolysaccharide export system permease protein
MADAPRQHHREADTMTGVLVRYIGTRFLVTLVAVLASVLTLIILIDYVETMRRLDNITNVSAFLVAKASLFRVPQFMERLLPLCVLTGTMSCYLGLSRRNELVVSRAAGMSAWQFTMPSLMAALLVGVFATAVYNPIAAALNERSQRLEAEISGNVRTGVKETANGFWVSQRTGDGHSIINATASRQQGVLLGNVTVFLFDRANRFLSRIEAKSAALESGHWRLDDARIIAPGQPLVQRDSYALATTLTPEQVRETFSAPEAVPFWQLPQFIELADRAGLKASAYRLQYQKLLARPFMLAAMVLLATAFSLRFFRFGGVQKMIVGGIAAGFLVYVISKVTDDLSKAEALPPMVAAWLPVFLGSLFGVMALLYQEDG